MKGKHLLEVEIHILKRITSAILNFSEYLLTFYSTGKFIPLCTLADPNSTAELNGRGLIDQPVIYSAFYLAFRNNCWLKRISTATQKNWHDDTGMSPKKPQHSWQQAPTVTSLIVSILFLNFAAFLYEFASRKRHFFRRYSFHIYTWILRVELHLMVCSPFGEA